MNELLPLKDRDNALAVTELDVEMVDWHVANMPPNTVRAYKNAVDKIDMWLGELPLNDTTLAQFIKQMCESENQYSLSTIRIVVAAVNKRSQLLNQPQVSGPRTKTALETASVATRERGMGQVKGLEWQDVQRICAVAEADGTIAGLRDSAMIQLMSDCLLRVSEVVAVNIEDVGKVLTIWQSKTDQQGKGAVVSIGIPTLATINEYRVRASIDRGALFRRIRRGDVVTTERLTPDSVRRIIKKWAGEARIPKARYSGHSLRVGSAISLAQAGAGIPEMQQVGRWKSKDMPAYYARGHRGRKRRYRSI